MYVRLHHIELEMETDVTLYYQFVKFMHVLLHAIWSFTLIYTIGQEHGHAPLHSFTQLVKKRVLKCRRKVFISTFFSSRFISLLVPPSLLPFNTPNLCSFIFRKQSIQASNLLYQLKMWFISTNQSQIYWVIYAIKNKNIYSYLSCDNLMWILVFGTLLWPVPRLWSLSSLPLFSQLFPFGHCQLTLFS